MENGKQTCAVYYPARIGGKLGRRTVECASGLLVMLTGETDVSGAVRSTLQLLWKGEERIVQHFRLIGPLSLGIVSVGAGVGAVMGLGVGVGALLDTVNYCNCHFFAAMLIAQTIQLKSLLLLRP